MSASLQLAALCPLASNGQQTFLAYREADTTVVQTPRIPMPPPFQEGWTLEDSVTPVTRPLYDTVSAMLTQMNAAIDKLPVGTTS